MTAFDMYAEYESQKLSTEKSKKAIEVISRIDFRLDHAIFVVHGETGVIFPVFNIAWDFKGDPKIDKRLSWAIAASTVHVMDHLVEKGYPVLVNLYSTPRWIPVFAIDYNPDFMNREVIQDDGKIRTFYTIRPTTFGGAEMDNLRNGVWRYRHPNYIQITSCDEYGVIGAGG